MSENRLDGNYINLTKDGIDVLKSLGKKGLTVASPLQSRRRILDTYWLEFLRALKEENSKDDRGFRIPSDDSFWMWYIDKYLEDK